jgi:hypothetical protein
MSQDELNQSQVPDPEVVPQAKRIYQGRNLQLITRKNLFFVHIATLRPLCYYYSLPLICGPVSFTIYAAVPSDVPSRVKSEAEPGQPESPLSRGYTHVRSVCARRLRNVQRAG